MVQSKVSRSALRAKKEKEGFGISAYIGAWSFLLVALVALFVLLLYKPFFQVSTITVEGTHVLHPYDIGLVTQEILAEKKIWLVPMDSWVVMPKKRIKQDLHSAFDRIKDVTIDVKNFNKVVVEINEWEPAFLWCNIDELNTERSCWFMDEIGNIFSQAPYFSPGVYPMFVTPASSLDAVLGEKKIDPEILEQVLEIYTMLGDKGGSIETIYFGEEMDVVFTLQKLEDTLLEGTEFLVTRTMPVDVIASNLDLLLEHTAFREKFDTQPELLEYIDLRFDGKLLFRFK